MSKHNKANKSNYIQSGRLTPDDMARERTKMRETEKATGKSGEPSAPRGKASGRGPAASPRRTSRG